jgi:hypothetical protein
MPTQLKVKDLVVGNRYNVFFLPNEFRDSFRKMHGLTTGAVEWTGTFTEIEDDEAIIVKDEKDRRGRQVKGYFGDDNYGFEEVAPVVAAEKEAAVVAPAVETYAAGPGRNAVLALRKTRGGRRKTRRSSRARKTRRNRK